MIIYLLCIIFLNILCRLSWSIVVDHHVHLLHLHQEDALLLLKHDTLCKVIGPDDLLRQVGCHERVLGTIGLHYHHRDNELHVVVHDVVWADVV